MEAARIHDEEATTMITKSDVTGQQTTPSASASAGPATEFHAVGENVIEMTSHGGK